MPLTGGEKKSPKGKADKKEPLGFAVSFPHPGCFKTTGL